MKTWNEKYNINSIKKDLVKYTKSDIQIFDKFTHQELLLKLLNIESKLIQKQKYEYRESDVVKNKVCGFSHKTRESYNEILNSLLVGNDINPFLSEDVFYGSKQDPLFLTWEIKHIHLNNNKTNGYFNKRADDLLMIFVQESTIYLLDIVKHKKKNVFEDIEYLKIIKRNWEDLLEPYKIPDRCCEEIDNPTNKEMKTLRSSNINTPICLDEEVYFNFNNGLSGAGTNFEHENLANEIINYINQN